MNTPFKLKYIHKAERLNERYEKDPDWENKIKEIQNQFSELIDKIQELLPNFNSFCPTDQWTPYWIAVYEIQARFNLPSEDFNTEYKINHHTLEITLEEE